MRRTVVVTTLCLLFAAGISSGATLGPELAQRLAAMQPGDSVAVILNFADRVDLTAFRGGPATAPDLIVALRDKASRSQARVVGWLGARGLSQGVRSFWINNSIALRVPGALLNELTRLPEIESIDLDVPVGFESSGDGGSGGAVYWNLTMIHADQVWSTYGLDGSGVVVGSMDTGFDPTHPALLGKWRGGTNSWIDIIGGLLAPYDDHGHGTHTIGTMVGGDGPGSFTEDIGVAYNAKFISAKVLDNTNSFSSASIVIAGAQWMLDPDGDSGTNDFPRVINNSWFFFSSTYSGFHSTIDAWRAAGIVPVFCIGNSGPSPSTTLPPASYDNTIGVGATDSGDLIASFSSRGPSPVGFGFPLDQRKPDLSAPGVLVRSSLPGGAYASWNGTSMAAPHVAGTVALMLQAHPSLGYDGIRSRLISTAVDLGALGYDFNYGYGRLDAFAAVTQALVDVPGAMVVPGPRLVLAPNPFGDQVRLEYRTDRSGAASLQVFDLQGRQEWSARLSSDAGSMQWDGRDSHGVPVPAGIYLVRLSDGARAETGRLLRVR